MERIKEINEFFQKAVENDFSSRIESSAKDDEIDKLVRSINGLFDRLSEY